MEIFISKSDAISVYKAIKNNGREFNLCDVGLHAVNSLELEKGSASWGHDIAAEDNLFEAGLCSWLNLMGLILSERMRSKTSSPKSGKLVQFKRRTFLFFIIMTQLS